MSLVLGLRNPNKSWKEDWSKSRIGRFLDTMKCSRWRLKSSAELYETVRRRAKKLLRAAARDIGAIAFRTRPVNRHHNGMLDPIVLPGIAGGGVVVAVGLKTSVLNLWWMAVNQGKRINGLCKQSRRGSKHADNGAVLQLKIRGVVFNRSQAPKS